MSRHLCKRIALIALAFIPLLAQAQQSGKTVFAAHIEKNAIVAEGLSRNQEVLLFGVSVETLRYEVKATRTWNRVAADDDGDGKVSFDFEKPVSRRSLWAAVDLRHGDYVVLSGDGYDVPVANLPATALRRGAKNDELTSLALLGATANVVVVRPGAGAWLMDVEQNGRNDEERTSAAVMHADLANLAPLSGRAAAPKALVPGDVLLVLNPLTIELSATRIER